MKKKLGLFVIAILMAFCTAFIIACDNGGATTAKALSSIEITTQPTKTTYTAGESFDPSGMAVTAKYSDNSSSAVTGYTFKTDALAVADTSITVSYTEESVTKTANVTITVNPATVLVNAVAPVVSTQPQGISTSVGTTHNLTVAASVADGGTLSYQWYSNTANSTTGGTAISGAINSTYAASISTIGTSYYYVVVTNTNNSVNGTKTAATTSAVATVTVNSVNNAAAPTISSQPVNASVNKDATATLSVTASVTDGGTLSYQWYRNTTNAATGGNAVSGATSAAYSAPTATVGTYYYYVIVTNTNNNAIETKTATTTSNVATLTVNPIINAATPSISAQPQNATVSTGTACNLSVTASVTDGGTLSYQWYSNTTNAATGGAAITGATNAAYTVPTSTVGTNYYYVVVTNTNNSVNGTKTASVTSSAATVVVNNLVNAQLSSITTQPQGTTKDVQNQGETYTLSITASVADSGTLSYQWYVNTANTISGSTALEDKTSNTLVVPTDTAYTYYIYCVVTNTITDNGDGGIKSSNVTSNIVLVKINPIVDAKTPVITKQPVSALVDVGQTHNISIMANVTDGGTLSYQWYKNTLESSDGGTAISGATLTHYTVPTDTAGIFYYYAVITNTNNSVNGVKTAIAKSNAVKVTINAPLPSLPQAVATLIQAIDKLPPVSALVYEQNAVLVKYLIEEYQKLSQAEQAQVINADLLIAAEEKIDELFLDVEFEVEYMHAGGDYPYVECSTDNPDIYKLSDGEVTLNDPIWSSSLYVFVEWREYYTETPVTTLAQALDLTEAWYIRLFPVFAGKDGPVDTTIKIKFVDEADGEELYTDTVKYNYGWYSFSGVQDRIADESKRWPISYNWEGNEESGLTIVNIEYGTILTVSVKTLAMREITFPAENEYDWELTYFLNDSVNSGLYISGTIIGGTSWFLPVGVDIMIEPLNGSITEILVDGTNELHSFFVSFTLLEGDGPVEITFTKTADTVARVVFSSNYYMRIFSYDASDWDGKLAENDLDSIAYNFGATYDISTTIYTINGTEYEFKDLSNIVFAHLAGNTTVVTVRTVSTVVDLTIEYRDSNSLISRLRINGTKTIAENIKDDALLKLVFLKFDLYLDEARSIKFEEDISTYKISNDITLYLAQKSAFTISFDSQGGTVLSSVQIPLESNFSFWNFKLPTPVRSGYTSTGWAFTADGEPFNSLTFSRLMTHYNKDVKLFAIWEQEIDTSDSSVLGIWNYYDDDRDDYYLEFSANGTGRIISIARAYGLRSSLVQSFLYSENEGVLTIILDDKSFEIVLDEVLGNDTLWLSIIINNTNSSFNGTYTKLDTKFIEISVISARYDYGNYTVLIPDSLKLSDFDIYGYGNVYFANKVRVDVDKTFAELVAENGGNSLEFVSIRPEYAGDDIRFIDLALNGGSLDGLLYVAVNEDRGNIFEASLPVPTKDGYLFIGWYTASGEKFNDTHWSYYRDLLKNNSGAITLYARYFEASSVDYSAQGFVGTWKGSEFYETRMARYELTLNADGTYTWYYLTVQSNNGKTEINDSGIYRLSEGEIVILTRNTEINISYSVQEVNISFVSENALIVNNSLLTKGAIKAVDYTGEDFIGEYEVFESRRIDGTDYYGEQRLTLTLNADGTYELISMLFEFDGEEEIYTYYLSGYYRFIDGEIVFLDENGMENFVRPLFKKEPYDYLALPVLGKWIADENDEMASTLFPVIEFSGDGIFTYHIEGLIISTGYKVTDDGYLTSFLYLGNIAAAIHQDGDTLTVTLYELNGNSDEEMVLTYVREKI